jgi:hypothetical protein
MTNLILGRTISDDLADVSASTADLATDIIGGIPVLGAVLDAARSIKNISNTLYLRKVAITLQELEVGTSSEDRARFLTMLEAESETERFGEAIILLIDKMDDMRKPAIVGRLLSSAMRGQLSKRRAMRLASIVNSVFVDDLMDLQLLPGSTEGQGFLASAGLLEQMSMTVRSTPNAPFNYTYQLSLLGNDLLKYGLTPYAGSPR